MGVAVFLQIVIGSAVLLANIAVMALAAFLLEVAFQRWHHMLLRPPLRPRLLLLLILVGVWVLAVITFGVWLWAGVLFAVGAFATVEQAVYYCLVVFTTLGLGDVIAPPEWRILAAMPAANGFLSFGLLTAIMVEALRQVRLAQIETRRRG
jgi:sterol desaturase/sphingolipid hydroxylase (fatty acid hydroxylase superfamily)